MRYLSAHLCSSLDSIGVCRSIPRYSEIRHGPASTGVQVAKCDYYWCRAVRAALAIKRT